MSRFFELKVTGAVSCRFFQLPDLQGSHCVSLRRARRRLWLRGSRHMTTLSAFSAPRYGMRRAGIFSCATGCTARKGAAL